jgi:hypothetical protein
MYQGFAQVGLLPCARGCTQMTAFPVQGFTYSLNTSRAKAMPVSAQSIMNARSFIPKNEKITV